MKTVDIKGKAYVQVNERIIYFRSNYKGWRLTTEIVSLIDGVVTMKALIHNPVGELIATGYAQEKDGSTFINKTSFIENCETSAWGRALGNLGIGIDTAVASSDEVENAIANQNKKTTTKKKPYRPKQSPKEETYQPLDGARITAQQKDKLIAQIQEGKNDLQDILNFFKIDSLDELNFNQAQQVIAEGNK
jgi:hypothetical protein